MLKGVSIKAVLVGLVADWILSLMLGVVVGIWLVVGAMMHRSGGPPNSAELDRMVRADSVLLLICLFGGFTSAIAGFAAGWIARSNRIKNAFTAGLVSALTSLVFLPFMHGYPAWYFPLAAFSTISFSWLGGYLSTLAFGVGGSFELTASPP